MHAATYASLTFLTQLSRLGFAGYIGSESFLDNVLYALDRVKALNPHVKYVCDPVRKITLIVHDLM
jgi:hypothetical protein